MNLLLSNPPRSKHRKSSRHKRRHHVKRRSSGKRNPPMAKRRRHTRKTARRRSSFRGFSRRRRSSRGRGSGGFALKELVMLGGIGAAGVLATTMLRSKLSAETQAKIATWSPYLQAAIPAVVGVAAGFALKKTSPKLARGLALGGLVAGGIGAGTIAMSQMQSTGHSALGRGIGLFPSIDYSAQPRLMAGLGRMGEEPAGNWRSPIYSSRPVS